MLKRLAIRLTEPWQLPPPVTGDEALTHWIARIRQPKTLARLLAQAGAGTLFRLSARLEPRHLTPDFVQALLEKEVDPKGIAQRIELPEESAVLLADWATKPIPEALAEGGDWNTLIGDQRPRTLRALVRTAQFRWPDAIIDRLLLLSEADSERCPDEYGRQEMREALAWMGESVSAAQLEKAFDSTSRMSGEALSAFAYHSNATSHLRTLVVDQLHREIRLGNASASVLALAAAPVLLKDPAARARIIAETDRRIPSSIFRYVEGEELARCLVRFAEGSPDGWLGGDIDMVRPRLETLRQEDLALLLSSTNAELRTLAVRWLGTVARGEHRPAETPAVEHVNFCSAPLPPKRLLGRRR
jgi:hypothetical protein